MPDPITHTQSCVLLGGGGHALVVASSAIEANIAISGLFDDAQTPLLAKMPPNTPHLGPLTDATTTASPWIIAVGHLKTRVALIEQMSSSASDAISITHPRAIVDAFAQIGAGVFIGPGAIINAHAAIGPHAIINSGAIIEHECQIGTNAHIAPGAVLGGNVSVGDHTLIGLGARVLPGVQIGSQCTIGAGAVVIADVPNHTTLSGVPAIKHPSAQSIWAPASSPHRDNA